MFYLLNTTTMNIEEEIARQNREIEDSLAKMKESINAQMKRMM